MKNATLAAVASAFLLGGCTTNRTAETKPIQERVWVGGHFEAVPTPAAVRTNSPLHSKEGALVTVVHEDTPLAKGGVQVGDLVLAVNGAKVHGPQQIQGAIEKNGNAPATFTIYRHGEIVEKTVVPGLERFQKLNMLTFGLGLSSRLEFDLFPNPDFSLVAVGYQKNRDLLDLRDPKSKYLRDLAAQGGSTGLRSEEGWKLWLGPLSLEQRRTILSQE